jgi:hypothetical protein
MLSTDATDISARRMALQQRSRALMRVSVPFSGRLPGNRGKCAPQGPKSGRNRGQVRAKGRETRGGARALVPVSRHGRKNLARTEGRCANLWHESARGARASRTCAPFAPRGMDGNKGRCASATHMCPFPASAMDETLSMCANVTHICPCHASARDETGGKCASGTHVGHILASEADGTSGMCAATPERSATLMKSRCASQHAWTART